ncbi:hypothetical protein M0802_000597 [Mischocyttarus mexicanus]|nr:hypothetical protein M0802_000597 [Mischocyttarus mexicanus]
MSVTLSLSSPELYGGLEMGEAGVLYLSEGQYARAAELFQKALDELIPVLKNEPPSIRRNLLQEQVDLWDKLHMAAVSHFTKKGVYTKLAMKSREFCVLQ